MPPQRLALPRTNLVNKAAETWRPPLFAPPGGMLDAAAAALRRYFDVQAGSIWRDLSAILPQVRGTLVDVGCGAQPFRPLVPATVKYLGIDTADAKANFGYEVPDTRYFEGNRWPVEDGLADAVLCTETLEHVLQPEQLLEEAFRALAPGGALILTVPFAARWHFIPYDYWRYTPSSLNHLFTRCGFTDVRVYARGNALTVACYKMMALILRLAMPQISARALRVALQLLSLPLIPLLLVLAVLCNLSLNGSGGDDCLGYTALATKRSAA